MSYQDITAAELSSFIPDKQPIILDMRDPHSFALGHLQGALPADEQHIRQVLSDTHMSVLVCCYHGHSSRDLATFLCQMGMKQVYNLEGGWAAYVSAADPQPSSQIPQSNQGEQYEH